MTQEIQGAKGSDWSKFLKKHWKAVALFAAAAILVFIGAVYIFLWFTGNAQTTDLVPKTLDLWTMANAVSFMLHLIFWELIFIGIPTIIGAIAGWQWWRRIPQEEKKEYHFSDRRSRTRGAGGAISPLLFIAFAIKVYVDGNWNTPISTWTLEYVAGSMITILVWIVAIFAIPATIGVIWWIHHEMTKKA
jgi:putative Mn2+ efflux pump MntP